MNKKIYIGLNIIVIVLALLLPYYIFGFKTPLGGDDTRLLYSYPGLYLKNVTFFSWFNVSTVGINASNQYTFPFLLIWSILENIVGNRLILAHAAFSIPIILGFVYFQKFIKEFFDLKNSYAILFIGALFYVFSPITIVNQYFIFLTPVWLVGLIPIIGYYLLKYLKTSQFKYAYIAMLLCFVFSVCLIAIPWIFGLLLPLVLGSTVFLFFYTKKEIFSFLKKSFIFFGLIAISQSYWILGFVVPYFLKDANSFVSKYGASEFADTFTPTVTSTATGSIIYPLLGLFHRQIAFDFVWQLKYVFIDFYDKIFLINSIYIFVLAVGIFTFNKFLDKGLREKYLFVLTSFIISLYFFTVNIGPMLDLFLFFGRVPGFIMFRNFYDKFALGYIFLYAILIVIGLHLVQKKFSSKFTIISLVTVVVILINLIPIKSIVNSPIWSTKETYRTLNIPKEYILFMKEIDDQISPTNNILSAPVGSSLYTAIKDEDTNNVYLGVSPVKIFSGVNDISGYLSFNFTDDGLSFDRSIIYRDYEKFNDMLYKWNINYLLLTKNLPAEILKSYGFGQQSIAAQDKEFLDSIVDKKILTSINGNYELYSTKRKNILLSGDNLIFQKISPVKYKLYIKDIQKPQEIVFKDSFYSDWKLFLEKNPSDSFCTNSIYESQNTKECKDNFKFLEIEDLKNLWKKSEFDETHVAINGVHNGWTIDPSLIRNEYGEEYYIENQNGGIDVQLTLYFRPQLYFYYGSIISIIVLISSTIYLLVKKNEKK